MSSGFFLVNKPSGITSSDLVQTIRKHRRIKKMGHTGTLDKFADGLLILPYGDYTCFSDYFLHLDKAYSAKILFGKSTDSGDPDGEILESWDKAKTEKFYLEHKDKIESEIKNISNITKQTPPKISALKIDGERQSDLFRKNISFESKERNLKIYSMKYSCLNETGFEIDLQVSSGTYIRKLIIDLSERLGFPMLVQNLTRTKIANFSIETSLSLKEIIEEKKDGYSLDTFIDFPSIIVNDENKKLISHGGYVALKEIPENFLLKDKNQKLLAWGSKIEDRSKKSYHYRKVFQIILEN